MFSHPASLLLGTALRTDTPVRVSNNIGSSGPETGIFVEHTASTLTQPIFPFKSHVYNFYCPVYRISALIKIKIAVLLYKRVIIEQN